MFVPTHIYQGKPVRLEGNQYVQKNGEKVPLRGFAREKLESTEKDIEITPTMLRLILQAIDPSPGNGQMNGYAVDSRGNSATLVAANMVRFAIVQRDGGCKTYLINVPDQFAVHVVALEE